MKRINFLFIMLVMLVTIPSTVNAVDYYLVGSWDGNWNSASSYKFTFTGTTGTVDIAASVLSKGTSDTRYFSILAIRAPAASGVSTRRPRQ